MAIVPASVTRHMSSMAFRSVIAALLLASLVSCTVPQALPRQVAADNLSTRPLKVASWNLGVLAEKDGTGC